MAFAFQRRFDVSRIYDAEPLSTADKALHQKLLGRHGSDGPALAMARGHAEAELAQCVVDANKSAWGYHSKDLAAPTSHEAKAYRDRLAAIVQPTQAWDPRQPKPLELLLAEQQLLAGIKAEVSPRQVVLSARRAAGLRVLLTHITDFETEINEGMEARWEQERRRQTEAADIAAFEAHEAAERDRRFAAFRAQRKIASAAQPE